MAELIVQVMTIDRIKRILNSEQRPATIARKKGDFVAEATLESFKRDQPSAVGRQPRFCAVTIAANATRLINRSR